jgi:hypothetical protein
LEDDTLTHTNNPYLLLSDQSLQDYTELIRDCDYVNRSRYDVPDGMNVGRI